MAVTTHNLDMRNLLEETKDALLALDTSERHLNSLETLNLLKRDLAMINIKNSKTAAESAIEKESQLLEEEINKVLIYRQEELKRELKDVINEKASLMEKIARTKALMSQSHAPQHEIDMSKDLIGELVTRARQLAQRVKVRFNTDDFGHLEYIPKEEITIELGYIRPYPIEPSSVMLAGKLKFTVGQVAELSVTPKAKPLVKYLVRGLEMVICKPDGGKVCVEERLRDGYIGVNFNIDVEGVYTVSAKLFGLHIKGSPLHVMVLPKIRSRPVITYEPEDSDLEDLIEELVIDSDDTHSRVITPAKSEIPAKSAIPGGSAPHRPAPLPIPSLAPTLPPLVSLPVPQVNPISRTEVKSLPVDTVIPPTPPIPPLMTLSVPQVDSPLSPTSPTRQSINGQESQRGFGPRRRPLSGAGEPDMLISPSKPPDQDEARPRAHTPGKDQKPRRSDLVPKSEPGCTQPGLPPESPRYSPNPAEIPLPHDASPDSTRSEGQPLSPLTGWAREDLNIKPEPKTPAPDPHLLNTDIHRTPDEITDRKVLFPKTSPQGRGETTEEEWKEGKEEEVTVERKRRASSSWSSQPKFSIVTNLLNLHQGRKIPGTLIRAIGGRGWEGPYRFYFPIGVTTNKDKDIIACDTANNLVKIFSFDGTFKRALGTVSCGVGFKRPSAAVVDPDSGTIYIKDDRYIQAFTPDGQFIRRIGEDILRKPYGLKWTQDRNLVTLDHIQRAIYVLSPEGEVVNKLPFVPMAGSPNSRFRFIAVHEDVLICVNLGGHEVVLVSLVDGREIRRFGSHGRQPGQFIEPSGVTCDHHGNILIADSKNNRITIFDMEGTFRNIVEVSDALIRPSDIHLTDDGQLIVDSYLQHCVKIYKLG